MQLPDDVLIAHARPWLERADLWRAAFDGDDRLWLTRALGLLRPRAKRLGDIAEGLGPLLRPVTFDAAAAAKHLTPEMSGALDALADQLADLVPFEPATIEQAVRGTAEARSIKAGAFMQAVRVSLTGRTVSPGLFETIELLGSRGKPRAHSRRGTSVPAVLNGLSGRCEPQIFIATRSTSSWWEAA